MVTGSRSWTHRSTIERVLAQMYVDAARPPLLLHGGARGADQIAADVAADLGWEVKAVYADWDRHGKKAGVLRNLQMLDMNPHAVLAFWDGQSKGTRHAFEEAMRRGIPTNVYYRRQA